MSHIVQNILNHFAKYQKEKNENKRINTKILSEKASIRFNFFGETAEEIKNIVNQHL